MAVNSVEIRVKGKNKKVPSAEIAGRTVIIDGCWIKMTSIFDEGEAEGELVANPTMFVEALKQSGLAADVLTFFQRPPDTKPKHAYPFEWENYAAVPVTTFEAWWNRLPQEARKNTRRAAKRGVEVRLVDFDDAFAQGVFKLYNESPVRQGKPFWHYGKKFATVKSELATYLDRSDFIAAYFENELIGFIKMVYVDHLALIMHILASNAHYDKRPMNALLAKAMEVCTQKGVSYFVYGNYVYGNKTDSSLVEFKRRNGFEQIDYPRYYLPLTLKGKIYVSLRLYRGLVGLLPAPVLSVLLKIRSRLLAVKAKPAAPVKEAEGE